MLSTIVAFSDSHGAKLPQNLINIVNESKYTFFLGDGINALGDLPLKNGFYAVSGNCDFGSSFPKETVVEIDGIRILLTHGDAYRVKSDLLPLALRAEELKCSVAFYGHTHFASIDKCENVTLICPGALSHGFNGEASYAYATVYNGKLTVKIVNIAQIC